MLVQTGLQMLKISATVANLSFKVLHSLVLGTIFGCGCSVLAWSSLQTISVLEGQDELEVVHIGRYKQMQICKAIMTIHRTLHRNQGEWNILTTCDVAL